MRLMGFAFFCLTFLAGVTVGMVEIALINVIVFMALALAAEHFLQPRYGRNGVVYAMVGAFLLSCIWPAAIHAGRDAAAPIKEPQITVTMSSAR